MSYNSVDTDNFRIRNLDNNLERGIYNESFNQPKEKDISGLVLLACGMGAVTTIAGCIFIHQYSYMIRPIIDYFK